tara:strand:- start:237 stop:359 length:123 start_codon:yes stop_codon:yes gene_type:complete
VLRDRAEEERRSSPEKDDPLPEQGFEQPKDGDLAGNPGPE